MERQLPFQGGREVEVSRSGQMTLRSLSGTVARKIAPHFWILPPTGQRPLKLFKELGPKDGFYLLSFRYSSGHQPFINLLNSSLIGGKVST